MSAVKREWTFSVIKCYVLNVYLEPDAMKRTGAKPCAGRFSTTPIWTLPGAHAMNKDAFLRRYLERLSEEFIRLFLKGSSTVHAFVFRLYATSKAPKYLALPATRMLKNMQKDEQPDRRAAQPPDARTFYTAFACQANGDTQYLDQELKNSARD